MTVLRQKDFKDGIPYTICKKGTKRVAFIVGNEENHVYVPKRGFKSSADFETISMPELLCYWQFTARHRLDKSEQYFDCTREGLKAMTEYRRKDWFAD